MELRASSNGLLAVEEFWSITSSEKMIALTVKSLLWLHILHVRSFAVIFHVAKCKSVCTQTHVVVSLQLQKVIVYMYKLICLLMLAFNMRGSSLHTNICSHFQASPFEPASSIEPCGLSVTLFWNFSLLVGYLLEKKNVILLLLLWCKAYVLRSKAWKASMQCMLLKSKQQLKLHCPWSFRLQLEKPLKRVFWLHQHVRSLPLQSLRLWSRFQNYLTHNDWMVLEDINSSLIQKQNTIAHRLRQLGVVSLHEQTCKAAVSLILHTLSSLPAYDVIHSMVMDFKGAFAASGGACKSGIYINKYPVNPSNLPPQLFKDAYGAEVPQPKVLEKLQVLKQHIPLRQTSKLLGKSKVAGSTPAVQASTPALQAQPATAPASIDPALSQQSMLQFGLLPRFQQVMQFQKQMLDMQQGKHTTTQPMKVDATASSTAVQKALTLKPAQKQTPDDDNKFRLPLADATHDGKQGENQKLQHRLLKSMMQMMLALKVNQQRNMKRLPTRLSWEGMAKRKQRQRQHPKQSK